VSKNISASVIAIGSELSTGKIQDCHGKYSSSVLSEMGFEVDSIVLVPDNNNIRHFIDIRINEIDLLIITGGLGPTSDDITRDLIAAASGKKLTFDNAIWESLKKHFPGKNNESRKQQAFIPEGFTSLPNFRGTAPGFSGYIGSTLLFCLPGPPVEMKDMFERTVVPDLVKRFSLKLPDTLYLSCFLICESKLEDVCRKFGNKDITWGTRVQAYKISLYLLGGLEEDRLKFFRYLQQYFGHELVVEGEKNPAELLFSSLKAAKKLLAVAESITGGLIGKLITDIPGSSKLFWGSLVTYSNESKKNVLGIKKQTLDNFGAVSKETVEEMSDKVLQISDSDISVSVSGYAGGGSDTEGGKTGLVWIAVSNKEGSVASLKFQFNGSRDLIRRKTAITAMLLTETALSRPERLDSCGSWQYS
jgi:nicotinamide-nucleotide amidase